MLYRYYNGTFYINRSAMIFRRFSLFIVNSRKFVGCVCGFLTCSFFYQVMFFYVCLFALLSFLVHKSRLHKHKNVLFDRNNKRLTPPAAGLPLINDTNPWWQLQYQVCFIVCYSVAALSTYSGPR